MGKLEGKNALITGGTTGIGLATAKLFQSEGARVAITGQNKERVANAGKELGPDSLAIVSDVGSLKSIDSMVTEVRDKFNNIDILFVNAGIFYLAPLMNVTEEFYDIHMDINLKGAFFTIQKTVPVMNDNGSIILNSSIANTIGFPGIGVYASTKAGLRSLARCWTAELIEKNIRVNVVSPGPIETPIFDKTGMSEEDMNKMAQQIISNVPMKRFGSAEEVASVVLFLAGSDSSYITGEDIYVDGGWTQL